MKFTIYGENVTINDEMRTKIEEKLSDLNRYVLIEESTTARVVVKPFQEGGLKVEVTIPSKIAILRAEIINDDFYNAVDLAITKIEDQIRRQKSRLSKRHKESLAASFIDTENTTNDVPVKTKLIFADEMYLDEAIAKMELLSHSFFIYKDIDSNRTSVVYKRNDGQYGLIEISE